jgi:predicted metal-dependent hydrolase
VDETARLSSRIRIHVHPDGSVGVETPNNADADLVRAAVQRRARWIFANLDANKDARTYALPRDYRSGETHFYLGRRYRLKLSAGTGAPSSVKLIGGSIEVTIPVNDRAAVKRRLNQWYQARAAEYFTRRLDIIALKLDWISTSPPMKLISMQKQWGNCSPSGSIGLNPALIRAPRHCIDYVLTHELCHLKEHNHSRRFYALLEMHFPNWVGAKSELDGLAELLLVD